MNNTIQHQKLVDDLLFEVGRLDYARVWPVVVGTFRTLHGGRIVTIGTPGMADISGILLCYIGGAGEPIGTRLEIECKTGGGKLSVEQVRFKTMIEKFKGIYIQARSVSQVLTELERYS
jgi:hypothetical protein